MSTQDITKFIHAHTEIAPLPFLPEIILHQAKEVTPLWMATETWAKETNLSPPFWAFAWPGGQAVARYILDNPTTVAGKRVLDFAAGSGLAAIAAAKAGARQILAADIDPFAQAATQMNAARNSVVVENIRGVDLTAAPRHVDMVIAGDVCYEQAMSHKVLKWLDLCTAEGIEVILGDPHRAYAPRPNESPFTMRQEAAMKVPVLRELEDSDWRDVTVWSLHKPTLGCSPKEKLGCAGN